VVSPVDRVSDESRDLYALVMPYIPSQDLRHLLEAGPLDLGEAFDIVLKITEILAYVHTRGVAHLDLKPENVLITPEREVRLTDFGIAQAIHGDMVRDGLITRTLSGTVYYLAPERLTDPESTDHRADLYALGILFHEMVTGQRPLAGTHFLDDFSTLHAIDDLKHLIGKLIHHDPDARYQTATDVANRIRELAAYRQIRKFRETPAPRTPSPPPASPSPVPPPRSHSEKASPNPPSSAAPRRRPTPPGSRRPHRLP